MSQPRVSTVDAALAQALDRIRPEAIDAHLRFLSHPLMEGRAPGTRGGRTAQEYIRAQMRRIGLEPAGGSYVQPVPMVGLDPHPELSFTAGGQTIEPIYRDDYVLRSGVPREQVETDAELVFVGYGITAPEYGWDDYEGVDVRGKVLLMRVNDPGTEATPGFFGGKALTYYGRWTYKYEEASRRGAAGAILIHTDDSAGYGWNVVRTSNTGVQYDLAGEPELPLDVRGWISSPMLRRVLTAAGLDLDDLLRRSEEFEFAPVPTGVRVHARVQSDVRPVETANVVGLLPGSDPARANEPVILASHYDHLGMTVDEDGTAAIYHGAYDNASGVAVLLAIAEAAASMPDRPARPMLFMSTTAEESGLLGSEWYARNPLFPLATTAAMLNVDGANLFGRTHDVGPLGADRSDLGDVVSQAAADEGMHVAPEAHPEQGMFFRQDHFPLARAGVPALAMDHGMDYEGRPRGWGEQQHADFVANHYHQPSDAYRDDFDYSGALQQARILLRTAVAVASADELPQWSPGAEFARR
ncbi:MAG TPA: M28 family peptidase [Longimicrobiaceae bacterium]|jgi:Zn-dependent M28 family amino/carboxypeptidase|nr:M28 family peptidase [Longimicrobiaceae bacterium]